MFYYISFFPDKKKIIILLSICSIVPPLIQAIFNVSRGGMIFYVLDFLLAYVIFYRFIKKEYKNRINKIFIILIILMVSLFTIISISRFSEGDGGAFFSVITYLGESYLDFSCSIWNSVIHHTNGSYNFPFLSSLLGQSIHTASKIDRFDYFYYHTGVPVSLFNPVPGNFYVEFGKIGGLIFCFIYGMLGIFFYRAKQKISFNKLIMFYVYSDMCLRGIFGYCMPEPELFFNIIFYFLFSKKIKIIKYK